MGELMRRDRRSGNTFRSLLIAFICGWLTLIGSIVRSDELDSAFDFSATKLTIFSVPDRKIIGHSVIGSKNNATNLIRGESIYLDGARDLELDYLKPGASGEAPTSFVMNTRLSRLTDRHSLWKASIPHPAPLHARNM